MGIRGYKVHVCQLLVVVVMMIHTLFTVLEEGGTPQCRVYAQAQGVRPNILHFGDLKFTCDSARGGKAAV